VLRDCREPNVPLGCFPADKRQYKEFDMLKFIGGTIGFIFIVGLIVVIGVLKLIF
jgi:hypothetical protein